VSPPVGSVSPVEVAVLVSGSGSILQAMLEPPVPVSPVPVGLVVSDRPCAALDIARAAGVKAELVDRHDWGGFGKAFDRLGYTIRITELLEEHRPDLIAMAGFGTVLGAPVHRAFPNRILNTHPSLLPSFPGWHGVEDALTAGVKVTGCTIHLASLELDAGPILAQEAVVVMPEDTVESLHERIKVVERRLYPATVLTVLGELAAGRTPDGMPRASEVTA
jgi:phosphoribosylglycinamide formyltransferase-1